MTMQALKVRKIGNSIGVILPKEVVEKLKITEGDQLFATESPEGINLTPYDPNFELTMKAFDRTNRKYRNALKELAK